VIASIAQSGPPPDGLNVGGRNIPFQEIEKVIFRYGADRAWDSKLAKWGSKGEQSILAHAINTYSVAKILSLRLKQSLGLSDQSILLTLIAAFVHDFEKETEEYQQSIRLGKAIDHCPIEDNAVASLYNAVQEVMRLLKVDLTDEELRLAFENVFSATTEHMKSEYNIARAIKVLREGYERDNRIASLVRTADTIASWKTLSDVTNDLPLLSGRCWISTHRVARIRGILTSILHEVLEQLAKDNGNDVLLVYPDGTLYIGEKNPFSSVNIDKISHLIDSKISVLTSSKQIANTIVGRPGRTVLKAPELIKRENVGLVLEEASRKMFKNAGKRAKEYIVHRLRLMNGQVDTSHYVSLKKTIDAEWASVRESDFQRYRDKYFPALSCGGDLSNELVEVEKSLLIEAATDAFVLCVFNEIRKECMPKDQAEKTGAEFAKQFDSELLERLPGTGGNDPVKWRFSVIDYFWSLPATKLDPSLQGTIGDVDHTQRRKLLVKRLTSILETFLTNSNISSDLAIGRALVESDLIEPKFDQSPLFAFGAQNVEEMLRPYYMSKRAKTDVGICAICGSPGEIFPATADLIGEGSESFTNKLPAGIPLGGSAKLRICTLCIWEATLRDLMGVQAPEEVILLMPQVNISRELYAHLARTYEDLSRFQISGFTPLSSYVTLADNAASGNISLCDANHLIPPSKSETYLDQIYQILVEKVSEDTEEIAEYLRTLGLDVPVCSSHDDIVRTLLDNLQLIESRDPEMFSLISKVSRSNISFVFQTPNFAAVFRKREIKLTKRKGAEVSAESDSGAALRKMLVGLALSKVMLCSVVFLKGLSIFENVTPKGALKIPEVLNVKRLCEGWTGKHSEWVSLSDRDALLKRIGAIFVVAGYTGLGIDAPFRCSGLSSGELLRRLETKGMRIGLQAKLLKTLLTIYRGGESR